jgi:hypothetical protein
MVQESKGLRMQIWGSLVLSRSDLGSQWNPCALTESRHHIVPETIHLNQGNRSELLSERINHSALVEPPQRIPPGHTIHE